MSIKPYFQSKNTYNIKLDKLKTPTKLNKLKAPLLTLEIPQKPTETTEFAVKRS